MGRLDGTLVHLHFKLALVIYNYVDFHGVSFPADLVQFLDPLRGRQAGTYHHLNRLALFICISELWGIMFKYVS